MTFAEIEHSDLQGKLQDLLRRKFSEVEIVSVSVSDTADFDEDEDGVEITILFRGTSEQLVRGRPTNLFEIVRSCLARVSADAFPVLNFISSDAHA